MAWTQYSEGLAIGDWVPQPDWNATRSSHGGWDATQSFIISRATLDDLTFQNEFSFGVPATTLDPNLETLWGMMKLKSVPSISHMRGGLSKIAVAYQGWYSIPGSGGGENEINPTYHLRGELGEKSILEHHKVLEIESLTDRNILSQLYSGELAWDPDEDYAANRVVDESGEEVLKEAKNQPSAGDALKFAKLIVQGVKSFRSPTFVWERRWQDEDGLTDAMLNKLGEIAGVLGDAPKAQGGRNWMLTHAGQSDQASDRGAGNVLKDLTLEWTLSEQGGWDTDLYVD
tara:strand:+ start:1369 stop:2229 length:861 start_codon:yes stop_codon:yes gene_type:complete